MAEDEPMVIFMQNRFGALLLSAVVLLLQACGGGGGGSDEPAQSPCSSLKIAGGEECNARPAAVTVVLNNRGYCSGVYITPRHVLTAAHCIPAGSRIVVASQGFSADAVRTAIHPLYDGSIDSPFDVAVVTIGSSAPITPVPIKLSSAVQRGDSLVVYGYGLDEDKRDIIARVRDGGAALKATFLSVAYVDPGTIGTFSNGGDTCRGDSGASLLFKGANGQLGAVAIVRAGPDICEIDSDFSSQNSNIQAQAVVDFILSVAPGAGVN
jgi:hypothetical protein